MSRRRLEPQHGENPPPQDVLVPRSGPGTDAPADVSQPLLRELSEGHS
jgi:hypothetical protein